MLNLILHICDFYWIILLVCEDERGLLLDESALQFFTFMSTENACNANIIDLAIEIKRGLLLYSKNLSFKEFSDAAH